MITDTTFMSTPHAGQTSGSTSKILRNSRAQLAGRWGQMLARLGDLLAERMDPVQGIESKRTLSGSGEEPQEAALALEQSPQRPGDGEDDVAVGHGGEDLFRELLREERRALGLTGRREVAGLAGERLEVLPAAGGTADPGEAVDQPAAVEKRLAATADHRAERAVARLEALLVDTEVALEVLIEESIEAGAFGMAGSIDRHPLGDADTPGAGCRSHALGGGNRVVVPARDDIRESLWWR